MRILVTGSGGMVGFRLATDLTARGHVVTGTVRTRPAPPEVAWAVVALDDPVETAQLVRKAAPELVVHTAYSKDELERDVVRATRSVADACSAAGVPLVAISTDAVFSGDHSPYAEDDVPHPVHPYGVAKRDAELAVLAAGGANAVARVALLADLDLAEPDPATLDLVEANRRGEPRMLFDDEIRSVVRLEDVVSGLVALAERPDAERRGCWHLGGPRPMARSELGMLVVERFGLDAGLVSTGSASSAPGPRPRDVTLTCDRARRALSFRPRPIGTVSGHGPSS